jgi:hypothetical protein
MGFVARGLKLALGAILGLDRPRVAKRASEAQTGRSAILEAIVQGLVGSRDNEPKLHLLGGGRLGNILGLGLWLGNSQSVTRNS